MSKRRRRQLGVLAAWQDVSKNDLLLEAVSEGLEEKAKEVSNHLEEFLQNNSAPTELKSEGQN